MTGLLQRARHIRRQPRTSSGEREGRAPEEDLSEDERHDIERQIDALFTERRTVPEHGPGKRLSGGAFFPAVVNVLVLLAVMGGFWFLVLPNWSTEAMVHSATVSNQTTEGFIVGRVREQAEQEISAQEQRIREVRRQLQELRGRRIASPVQMEQAGERAVELEDELNRLIADLEQQRSGLDPPPGDVTSAYGKRLRELQQRHEEHRFVLYQLGHSYLTVGEHLSTGNRAAAVEELTRADRFLADYSEGTTDTSENTLTVLEQGNAALMAALWLLQDASDRDSPAADQSARPDGDDDAALREDQRRLERELQDSRERIGFLESRITARNRSIAALHSEVQARLTAARTALADEMSAAHGANPERVADLLETKTRIREVLNSDVVQRDHPDLYLGMEQYLDALGETRVAEGRSQGRHDAVVALQELMNVIGITPANQNSSFAHTHELRAALAEEMLVLVQGVLSKAQ